MTEHVVYKYPLAWSDEASVMMPRGARVLAAQPQGSELFVWALVRPGLPLVERRFRIAGTGHPIEGVVEHISTIQMQEGALVFHVFERDPVLTKEDA